MVRGVGNQPLPLIIVTAWMVCALILENIISALAQLNARSWQKYLMEL